MPKPADTAAFAADALVTYWTGASGQDILTRDRCRRLAELVECDFPVPLENRVKADPARARELVRDAVRSVAGRSAEVRAVCAQLAARLEPDAELDPPAPRNGFYSSVIGDGNVVTQIGRDLVGIVPSGPPVAPRRMAAQPRHPAGSTTVLFTAAQPVEQVRIACEREAREVRNEIDIAKRRHIRFRYRSALTVELFTRVLLNMRPQVVHFSGHGAPTGDLCFETTTGHTAPVSPDALQGLFAELAEDVTCVVLNACYSELQARAIAEHIPYVIGMTDQIGDQAATAFSVGFYQALAAERDVGTAFRLGQNMIRMKNLQGHMKAVLIPRRSG